MYRLVLQAFLCLALHKATVVKVSFLSSPSRQLNPNLLPSPSRRTPGKRRKKCLCSTWTTVSSSLAETPRQGSKHKRETTQRKGERGGDRGRPRCLRLSSLLSTVEPAASPQVTPVNSFLSNSLVTDLEGLSLSDAVLSPAVRTSHVPLLLLLLTH